MRNFLLILLYFLPAVAWADYVQVERSANIYALSNRHSTILEHLDPAASAEPIYLTLIDSQIKNGYHHVRLSQGSSEGWVYKTLVREFSGDPPGTKHDDFYGGYPDDSKVGDQITHIKNSAYAVGYSETKADPLWAAYQLGADQGFNCPRLPRFRTDERTVVQTTHDSYNNMGYDRGHMTPSDNIGSRYGCEAQNETYFMSNIAPQLPSLNQKSWLGLEKLEASYSAQFGHIWVIDGPIFDPEWIRRLCSGIELPIAFYKIIVREVNGKPSVLATIFDQDTKPGVALSALVTTVDEIQKRTGIDFLSELPDDVERSIERTSATDAAWKLDTKLNSNFKPATRSACIDQPVKRGQ